MQSDSGYAPEFVAAAQGTDGGLSREEVLEALARARADGSLDQIHSEGGYAPEFGSATRRPAQRSRAVADRR
jgi:hypothetical protein